MQEAFELAKKKKNNEEKKAEALISEEELSERMKRLSLIGRVIGEDLDMKVEIGKERGWRYIFHPVNKIEVDLQDVKEKGDDYCLGVIAHEGAHRAVSRVDFIPKKIWQEAGFRWMSNAIEDPRVNNWVAGKYDGAQEWLKEVYDQDLGKKEKAIEVKVQEKVKKIPRHIKFGLEINRFWHTGKYSKDLEPEILEALEKTQKYAQISYGLIPEKDPSEEEIKEQAIRSYKVNYSTIWPEYKKLVEKDLEDETTRQVMKEMAESGELDIPPEGQSGGEPLPLDQIPEELKEKLKKKIKEILESKSEEEKKELEEKAKKAAKKNMEDIDDEASGTIKGKFSEQPESTGEERKRKEKEEEEKKRAEELEGELKKAREEIEKKLEAEKTEYDRAYEEVRPYIQKLSEDIINLFSKTRFPQFREGFPGQALASSKQMMAWESRHEYKKLFKTREKVEKPDYTFLILVDLSGSMGGQKIEETFKGVVLFAEVLDRVAKTIGGLKVAVYGFQDDILEYKKFGEDLDNLKRKEMSVMKKEVSNSGKHNKASFNNDGYCLFQASRILEENKSRNNFLLVLSDGEPAGDAVHHIPGFGKANEEEELKRVARDTESGGASHLIGIGLGEDTEHVAKYYSEALPNIDIKKLSETIVGILEKYIV